MRVEPQQLKAFLLDAELVTEEQFKKAENIANKTNQKVGNVLVSQGLISQEELIRMEAYILGIPFVNLEKEKIEEEVLKIIPEPIARFHNIVAFRKKGKDLEVAMLDPEDLRTTEFIKRTSDFRILPRLTTKEEKLLKFDAESQQKVLDEWQKRNENFYVADFKEYPDPFKVD